MTDVGVGMQDKPKEERGIETRAGYRQDTAQARSPGDMYAQIFCNFDMGSPRRFA